MKIVQINQYDALGGAARVCWYLFDRYRRWGHRSYLVVGQRSIRDPHVIEVPNDRYRNPWSGLWNRAQKLFDLNYQLRILPGIARSLAALGEPRRWMDNRRGMEDFHCPAIQHLWEWLPMAPDVVHLHNLHGDYPYFDLRQLPFISKRVPTIITLHDEWCYTGHCAYTLHCQRWRSGCGHCPDLTIYPPLARDGTALNWKRKKSIYDNSRLHVAAPSQWLLNRAKASVLAGGMVASRVIHNGIDTAIFHPSERRAARCRLHLPRSAWIVLFVGHGTRSNRFKDYATIRKAFIGFAAQLPSEPSCPAILICVGESGPTEEIATGSIRFIDYQKDQEVMADYYRAADVCLHAAHCEVWGLVVTEAMACGIPVIATAVGGIPEQIDDGRTGFLVPKGDSEQMTNRLLLLKSDEQLRTRIGAEASREVRDRFSLKRMADRYLQWYQEIAASRTGAKTETSQ